MQKIWVNKMFEKNKLGFLKKENKKDNLPYEFFEKASKVFKTFPVKTMEDFNNALDEKEKEVQEKFKDILYANKQLELLKEQKKESYERKQNAEKRASSLLTVLMVVNGLFIAFLLNIVNKGLGIENFALSGLFYIMATIALFFLVFAILYIIPVFMPTVSYATDDVFSDYSNETTDGVSKELFFAQCLIVHTFIKKEFLTIEANSIGQRVYNACHSIRLSVIFFALSFIIVVFSKF